MAETRPGGANPPADLSHDPTALPAQLQRRRRVLWIAIGVVLLALLFFLHRCSRSNSATSAGRGQGNASVTVGTSTSGDMGIYINALGTVTPMYTVSLYSQITGRVMAVHYQEGQMVRKGDPLIDIDPRPSEAVLMQAEGTLQRDQAQLSQARMDLQRYQDAYARNAIAKQQLDDQQHAVAQLEGTVKADRGSVAYDRVQLEYCHIVAPIAGRVGLRLVDPGNTVFAGSGSTLIVITQLQPITVVFSVSEDDLPRVQSQLQSGQKLTVDAFDRSAERLIESGSLTSLDNQVDTTTGTVRFRAEFPNQALALFPNQFVNARLLVQTLHAVTIVPSVALQHNGTNSFVYRVNADNTVAVQPVTVLTSNEDHSAVQGLDPGTPLALSGFDRLENGAHITVRTAPAARPAGSAQPAGTDRQRPAGQNQRRPGAQDQQPPAAQPAAGGRHAGSATSGQ